jgi:hypothetical protein
VNKLLQAKAGCDPLPLVEVPPVVEPQTDKVTSEADPLELTEQELQCVQGNYGTMVDLRLSRRAFDFMQGRCRTKTAIKIGGDPTRCKVAPIPPQPKKKKRQH